MAFSGVEFSTPMFKNSSKIIYTEIVHARDWGRGFNWRRFSTRKISVKGIYQNWLCPQRCSTENVQLTRYNNLRVISRAFSLLAVKKNVRGMKQKNCVGFGPLQRPGPYVCEDPSLRETDLPSDNLNVRPSAELNFRKTPTFSRP